MKSQASGMIIVHFESLEAFLEEAEKIGDAVKVYTIIKPINRVDAYVLSKKGLALHLYFECQSENELNRITQKELAGYNEVPQIEIP